MLFKICQKKRGRSKLGCKFCRVWRRRLVTFFFFFFFCWLHGYYHVFSPAPSLLLTVSFRALEITLLRYLRSKKRSYDGDNDAAAVAFAAAAVAVANLTIMLPAPLLQADRYLGTAARGYGSNYNRLLGALQSSCDRALSRLSSLSLFSFYPNASAHFARGSVLVSFSSHPFSMVQYVLALVLELLI